MIKHLIFAVVLLLFVSLCVIEVSYVIDMRKEHPFSNEGEPFLHFSGMMSTFAFSIVTLMLWVSPNNEIKNY